MSCYFLLNMVLKRVSLKYSTSPVESLFLIIFVTIDKKLSTGLVKHFLLLFAESGAQGGAPKMLHQPCGDRFSDHVFDRPKNALHGAD